MIRRAEVEDIPALVEIGRRFHDMSPHRFMGEYDPEGVGNTLAYLITNPGGLVLTNGKGLIGGMLAPVYFAPSKLMMEEAFWFAEGGGRDLLRAFEAEAQRMGAAFVLLSTLENEKTAFVDRMVSRMGYRAIERRHLKELV